MGFRMPYWNPEILIFVDHVGELSPSRYCKNMRVIEMYPILKKFYNRCSCGESFSNEDLWDFEVISTLWGFKGKLDMSLPYRNFHHFLSMPRNQVQMDIA